MSDPTCTIEQLRQWVRRFSQDRDWEQFHHPKDLGLALAIEVGELLEHFRYLSNEAIAQSLREASRKEQVAHELADCLWLLLRLSDVLGIDLSDALRDKLALADRKYPADVVRGQPHKYTEYPQPSDGTPRSER